MYDNIIFEHIKCCTVIEKQKLLTSIDIMLKYSKNVSSCGIFSLEEELISIENKFLKKALQMLIDGREPELLKQILQNYIMSSNYKPAEILERIIFLEGTLAIQEGAEEDVIIEKLISFLGEDFLRTAEEYYGLNNETLNRKRNDYLLKVEQNDKVDTRFEKTIDKMNERSLQRLLREIDTKTLVEALCNFNFRIVKRVLNNVSVRAASTIITELEKKNGIRKNLIQEAQDYILKVMQRLVESKDIEI